MRRPIKTSLLRMIRRNDGSAMIEFAIVAPVFFLLFFGLIEFGLFTYHKMAIERISAEVSRLAAIGKTADASGPCSGTTDQITYINCIVHERAKGLINGDRIRVLMNPMTHLNAANPSYMGTSAPDICLDDEENPNSTVPTCTKWEDVNGNGTYDPETPPNAGLYGMNMEVRIYYPWSVQLPLLDDYFTARTIEPDGSPGIARGIVMIDSATIFKNEPM